MGQMNWRKLGQIITPENINRDWMVTHAMDPTVDLVEGDVYRFYFCGRNDSNQSLIGYADIDLNDPTTILCAPKKPVLGLGSLGAFDDNDSFTLANEIYIDNKPDGYSFAGDHPRLTEQEFLKSMGIDA